MKIMKLGFIAVICFIFVIMGCGIWYFDQTLKSTSNISFRNNAEIYKGVTLSEDFRLKNYNLLEFSDKVPDVSKIKIFESKDELEGINIVENFFDNNILGMVIVSYGGGIELRNANVFNNNGYVSFSVDIWLWSGVSTLDLKYETFFIKIPK